MASRLHNKVVRSGKQKPVPVRIVHEPIKSSPVSEDMSWRARDDMRTLQQAAEIQADKARVRAVKAEAQKQMKNLSKICK